MDRDIWEEKGHLQRRLRQGEEFLIPLPMPEIPTASPREDGNMGRSLRGQFPVSFKTEQVSVF